MQSHTILHLFAVLALVGLTHSRGNRNVKHRDRRRTLAVTQNGDFQHLLDGECLHRGVEAPHVPNAIGPRYIKRKVPESSLAPFSEGPARDEYYLLAVYACQSGHEFLDGHHRAHQRDHGVLYCGNGKWIGARPICIAKINVKGHALQEDQTNAVAMEWLHPRAARRPRYKDELQEEKMHRTCMNCNQQVEECLRNELGRWRCACKAGFKRRNGVCEDLNECKIANPCQHDCTNLPGAYKCHCKPGYRLLPDGESCEDINECFLRNGHGPCEDRCLNSLGSYSCVCEQNGTRLSLDGHTCDDVNECDMDTSGCSHGCINTRGKAFCYCPDGMMLDSDWKTCIDKPLGDQGTQDEYYDENEGEDEYIDGDDGRGEQDYDDTHDNDYDEGEERTRNYDEGEEDRSVEETGKRRIEAQHENKNDVEPQVTEEDASSESGKEVHIEGEEDTEGDDTEVVEETPEGATQAEEHVAFTESSRVEETSKNEGTHDNENDGGSEKIQAIIRDLEENFYKTNEGEDVEEEVEDDYGDEDIIEDNDISITTNFTNKPPTDNKQEDSNHQDENFRANESTEEIDEETLTKTHAYQLGSEDSNNTSNVTHESVGSNVMNLIPEQETISYQIHSNVKSNKTIEKKDDNEEERPFEDKDTGENEHSHNGDHSEEEEDEYDNEDTGNKHIESVDNISSNDDNVMREVIYEPDEYDEESKVDVSTMPATTTTATTTSTTIVTPTFISPITNAQETLETVVTADTTTSKYLTSPEKEDVIRVNEDEEAEDYEYTYEEYEDNDHDNTIPLEVLTTSKLHPPIITSTTTAKPEETITSITGTGQKLCNAGFRLNKNFDCVDMNECDDPEHGCSDLCVNTVGSYKCSCPSGYEITSKDKYTCLDIDECTLGVCSHDCFNVPGSFTCECPQGWLLRKNTTCYEIQCQHGFDLDDAITSGYVCRCPKGFALDMNGTCEDINECLNENLCEHRCTNIQGGYICTCKPGFSSIGNDCDDVNECLNDNGGCQQLCANSEGSFECGCEEGYYLGMDNRSCFEIDHCAEDNGNCSDLCKSTRSGVACECRHGRELQNDDKTCLHINPCHVDNGGCSHQCIYKEYEGVECVCPLGHQLLIDARTCEEINPCFEDNGGCSHLCITSDTQPLEAICKCPDETYELKNKTCFKVNPCLTDNGGCSHGCHFEQDEVRCTCPETFKLFGKVCQRRNLCEENNGGCSHFCNFVNDTIICECPKGFELVEKRCERIDPCLIENGGCSHVCISDDFEVECHCPINYELTSDGRTCKAVDPCYNNGGCSHFCLAHRGRTLCYCPLHYELKDEKTCVQVNPCLDNNGNCSHKCHNRLGKVECQCPIGYVLVNTTQCANPCFFNNGGCSHECKHSGSEIICLCPSGYHLEDDKKTCEEINPCRDQNGGCSHTCRNDNGQVVCTCPDSSATTRYELIGKTCKVIDPCLINNGGCSHTCVTLDQKPKCECPPNYILHGKICFKQIDSEPEHTSTNIDPCAEQNGGCSHNCTVRNGTKECSCPLGFVLRPNRKACKDINECMRHNGGCSHTCKNTPGSYKCLCPKGFRLQGNNHTCVTGYIRACSINNGGCQHLCEDLKNGHRCSCRVGFDLQRDGRTCEEAASFFECHVKPVKFGRVKCTTGGEGDYVAVGTQCLYSCDEGYKLVGEALRTCEYSGDWDLDDPVCSPAASTCSKLNQPSRGRILPHSCATGKTSVGQSCGVHCRAGHKLINSEFSKFTCEQRGDHLQWSVPLSEEALRNACVPKEIPKPFIRCPGGGRISFTLPTGARVMPVRITRPDSNVDWWRFVHSVPAWGKQLTTTLPPGRFEVIFTATSPNPGAHNLSSSCNLIVHVKDEEPPKVFNCPPNQEVRLDRSEYSKNVYWSEPRFEDNIGIRTVYKSKEPGTSFSYGLHHVNYIASDDAGNRAYCHFTINVVNYYQQEYTSNRMMTRYRSVLICPHGIQYMSNSLENYDNSITSENGCKWTYIRLRNQMGQPGYRIPTGGSHTYHEQRNNQIRDIPYTTPMPIRRHPRERFQWCC